VPIATTEQRNRLATAYGVEADEARLYSTVPGAAAGTQISGAIEALTWSAPSNGVITATAVFDVPAGAIVRGAGVHDSTGTYLDGGSVPEQEYATAGTYELVLTYTQA
jgi:hypothetical protein